MPYYHVKITKKNGNTKFVFAFDLSKNQLMNEIVTPFLKGQQFMCEKSVVRPTEIDYIGINVTEQSSADILRKTRSKRIMRKLLLNAIATDRSNRTSPRLIDAEYIINAGKDVTRELIKGRSPHETKTFELKKEQVFIVHGKDHNSVKELKAILKEVGLEPIILHEQASGSRTIVEKLEKYSDVGYAFVLLTPDDFGGDIDCLGSILFSPDRIDFEDVFQMELAEKRARQNVILEFGYFIGVLGRDKVCCLYKADIELPSDMQGIVYIQFEQSVNEVKGKIIKELREAGYEIKSSL